MNDYPTPDNNPNCQCKGNPLLQFFCRTGHMTECHYPQTCQEAECSHYEAEYEAELEDAGAVKFIALNPPEPTSGYDKYLEYQFGMTGDFYTNLFHAIQFADEINTERLRKGFPEEVDAYDLWAHVGREAFLAKCSNSPLVERMRND